MNLRQFSFLLSIRRASILCALKKVIIVTYLLNYLLTYYLPVFSCTALNSDKKIPPPTRLQLTTLAEGQMRTHVMVIAPLGELKRCQKPSL